MSKLIYAHNNERTDLGEFTPGKVADLATWDRAYAEAYPDDYLGEYLGAAQSLTTGARKMKLTSEQIAKLAPSAAMIRVNGNMYQIDWVDGSSLQYSDPDEYYEFEVTFTDLQKDDVIFYELTEMKL